MESESKRKQNTETKSDSKPIVKNRTEDIFSWISLIVASMGISIAIYIFVSTSEVSIFENKFMYMMTSDINKEIKILDKRIQLLSDTLATIQSRLDKLQKIPKQTKITLQMDNINQEIGLIKESLSVINNAILDNPTKALTIPLLRKDLENLENTYKENFGAIRQDVIRVYDQNKWFIGLMFTMAIGLLGLAAGNLIQSRKKNN